MLYCMVNEEVFEEGSKRTSGTSALTSNIEAAKAISSIIKTTLGPMGMDKMLIDSTGETTITNDGVKILKEMEIEHPGAKLLVDVAKTQENEVGDGTTTAVILSGELLSRAQKLLDKKIHPTNIILGYKKTSDVAIKILNEIAIKVDSKKEKMLKDLSSSAMTGKVAEFAKDKLSELLIEVTNKIRENNKIDKSKIKVMKATGGEIKDSFVFNGVILDRDLASSNMIKSVKNAKTLLVDFPLEVRELDSEAKININSVEEYEEFLKNEENYLIEIVEKIKKSGAKFVVCQKGIDDSVSYYLAKEGIIGIRRCRKSDMKRLSELVGVSIVNDVKDITKDNLGIAKSVEVKEVLNDNYIFVEGSKLSTIMLKGSTNHVLDEIERAIEDALGDITSVVKSGKIVAGGGAIELEINKRLNEYVKKLSGKEQIIANEFSKSFLIIPKVLCENCGLDEVEVLATLISKHEKGLDKSGINSYFGIVDDTMKLGIIEPINIKEQAIKSAVENSSMILRIDDIIAAKKGSRELEE